MGMSYKCLSSENITYLAYNSADAKGLSVRLGSLRKDSGGSLIVVSHYIKHPSFTRATMDYDIALVFTSSDIPIDGSTVKAVTLATAEPLLGTNLTVTGWGGTDPNEGLSPTTLKKVTVPVVSRIECTSDYKEILTPRMICAGFKAGGKGFCKVIFEFCLTKLFNLIFLI